MTTQTLHLIIDAGLAVAIGSAMPDRVTYKFPHDIGLYIFDWVYRTVKIITFNVAQEFEKKGFKLQEPPQTLVVSTATASTVTTAASAEPPQ